MKKKQLVFWTEIDTFAVYERNSQYSKPNDKKHLKTSR
jgi:hypothetical protein